MKEMIKMIKTPSIIAFVVFALGWTIIFTPTKNVSDVNTDKSNINVNKLHKNYNK